MITKKSDYKGQTINYFNFYKQKKESKYWFMLL